MKFFNIILFLSVASIPFLHMDGYAATDNSLKDSVDKRHVFYQSPKLDSCRRLVLDRKMDTIYTTLSVDEITAIYYYTTTLAYKELNSELRKYAGKIEELSEFNQAYFAFLYSGLEKIPSKFSGRLYRGTSLSNRILKKYKHAFLRQNVVTEWAFTSTSEEADVARFQYFSKLAHEWPVLFLINATGRRGSPIYRFSAYGKEYGKSGEKAEREVLFKSGTRFKVTGYQEKKTSGGHAFIEIEMEELASFTP